MPERDRAKLCEFVLGYLCSPDPVGGLEELRYAIQGEICRRAMVALPKPAKGKPRLAGQGPSELWQDKCEYFRVTIEFGNSPDTCFKVAVVGPNAENQIRASLHELCPRYARMGEQATKVRIQPWGQFSAVLVRGME